MKVWEVERALCEAGVENAANEARWLCESLSEEARAAAVDSRAKGVPLAYILGEWDFFRETYEVSPDCLIPRADTEVLVEEGIARVKKGARVLDLCTGSGCVAVSLAAARPDLTVVGVDLYPQTLKVATRNAARNKVAERVSFQVADVLQAPPQSFAPASFDAILANPPYIEDALVPTLSREVQCEPRAALCGGADGIDFYRAILEKWQTVLKKGGLMLFEIGYDQADAITRLAEPAFSVQIRRDYGGRDRVAILLPL